MSKKASSSRKKLYRVGRSKTGLGLFATEVIKKGDFIAEYWGKRVPTKTADDINSKYLFELNSRWTIDGATRRNTARYINHGCKPNAESDVVKGRVIITATKTINPGDEITYNYGKNYFDTFIKPLGCKCVSCIKKRREAAREERLARAAAKKRAAKRAERRAAAAAVTPATTVTTKTSVTKTNVARTKRKAAPSKTKARPRKSAKRAA